jgi:hypothetical protein
METYMNNPTLVLKHYDVDWETKSIESEVTVESSAVLLSEVLTDIELFLKGCGYVFDGHLDIVTNEDQHE